MSTRCSLTRRRLCSSSTYQTHSETSESQHSPPCSSISLMRSALAKVLRRQKISPTMPMSGREGSKSISSGAEALARPLERGEDGRQALLVRDLLQLEGGVDVGEACVVDRVGRALLDLVGPRLEQQLHEDVLRHDGSPRGADEVARVLPDRRVAVVGGDGDHRHVVVAQVVERAPDEVHVLAEAAGSVGRRHEEGDPVAVARLEQAEEVTDGDLLRVALVARGHLAAQLLRVVAWSRASRAPRRRSSGWPPPAGRLPP